MGQEYREIAGWKGPEYIVCPECRGTGWKNGSRCPACVDGAILVSPPEPLPEPALPRQPRHLVGIILLTALGIGAIMGGTAFILHVFPPNSPTFVEEQRNCPPPPPPGATPPGPPPPGCGPPPNGTPPPTMPPQASPTPQVTIVPGSAPILSVSPQSHQIVSSCTGGSVTVVIANIGGGVLHWMITSDNSAYGLSPVSGMLEKDASEFVLVYHITHAGTLHVTADAGQAQPIAVTCT
jgi:hypothetical protein